MNEKIKNYVELLFEGVPKNRKAIELKNEILSNLNDKFKGFLAEGKQEAEAYGFAIAELGDIDALIQTVLPDKEITEKLNREKKRKASITAASVSMYICSPAVLILLSMLGYDELGIIALIIMTAIVIAALVYLNMSTPSELTPYLTDEKKHLFDNEYPTNQIHFLRALEKFYWTAVPLIYLLVSFITMEWGITWLIFIAASAIWQGIKLLFFSIKKDK